MDVPFAITANMLILQLTGTSLQNQCAQAGDSSQVNALLYLLFPAADGAMRLTELAPKLTLMCSCNVAASMYGVGDFCRLLLDCVSPGKVWS